MVGPAGPIRPIQLLTAGVTEGRSDPEAAAAWAAAVHQSVREIGGRVLGPVIGPGPGTNYYLVRVQLDDGTPLRLMLNLAIGLVGAADDRDPHDRMAAFRDVPRPDVFGLFGFSAARPSDLEASMSDDQASELTVAEHRDLAYHRPPRVGDVIFNWFD